MSEAERKRRFEYKMKRKRLIIIQTVVLALVAIAILISSITYLAMNKTYYINYTESGEVDYKVHIKENEFYDGEWLEDDRAYISTLIDGVLADFSYKLDMETDNVSYEYSYGIAAVLHIIDDRSKEVLFNPEYVIKESQKFKQNSKNELQIRESVIIDYGYYNELAKKFVDTYSLSQASSSLILTMNIEVMGDSENFESSSENKYSTSLVVPLAEQTISINMLSSVPTQESKVLACTDAANYDVVKSFAIGFSLLEALLLLIFIVFIYITRNEDINYTIKVKKLVSAYRSYIQKINNAFDSNGYQTLEISSFNEMLEIRDIIQSPILMHENEDCTCTKFFIPTNTKILYTYEIKVDDYDEIYKKKEDGQGDFLTEDAFPITFDMEVPKVVEAKSSDVKIEEHGDSEAPVLAEGDDEITVDGNVVVIRYRSSFSSRLIQCGEVLQTYYGAIKNRLASYKGVKARTSWSCETFNKGRNLCAKINVKGKAVLLSLPLNPQEYNINKYHFTDMSSNPKFEKLPMLLKIKSERGVKYALELIDEVMSKLSIAKGEDRNDNYIMPYETNRELAKRNLVKIILPAGVKLDGNISFAEADVEEHISSGSKGDTVAELENIKAIVESEHLEITDTEIEEAIDQPETELSEIDYVDEIDEEYTESDEHPGVDVIGVVWPERAHKNKIYRYDPNGETLNDGDIVLVPSKDVHRNKDVIRKAAVAHGNHKVDPSTLQHPLKKIIAVVKRKAQEALFDSQKNIKK